MAFLLVLSMIVSRDLKSPDALLVIGTIFLVFAIYKSSLPTQAVFQNVRHLSLILSVVFAGLYLAVKKFWRKRQKTPFIIDDQYQQILLSLLDNLIIGVVFMSSSHFVIGNDRNHGVSAKPSKDRFCIDDDDTRLPTPTDTEFS